MSSYHHIHVHLHRSVCHSVGIRYFIIWYWRKKETAAERLRDLRDPQCDPALVEGAAPVEGRHDEPEPVSMTFSF